MNRQRVLLSSLDNMVFIILAVVFLFFGALIGGPFMSTHNLLFILYISSLLAPMVLAEGICLISGNFDLSVAEIAGLSAMFTASMTVTGLCPPFLSVPLILVSGSILGAVNGFFVGRLGLNPFLVTLSTNIMYQWFIYVVRQNTVTSLPASFIYLGAESIFGIQVVVPFMIIVSLVLSVVMRKTRFGNYVYAVGGNPQAATMLGINSKGIVFAVFVISGFFSGMTGLLYAGFVQSVSVELTNGLVFTAFAGAVLGGISLKGGSGKISNAYGGIVLMGTIQAGSHMLLLPPEWVGILTGGLILGAILLNQAREKIRKRLLMPVE